MTIHIPSKKEVEITHIKMDLPVRYQEEDIPNDFPLRKGDMWSVVVNIDTGEIANWPKGKSGRVSMKVCDEGTYTLLDKDGKEVAKIEQDYVPNDLVPGEYGDYVRLTINAGGVITNWPRDPDVNEFFKNE